MLVGFEGVGLGYSVLGKAGLVWIHRGATSRAATSVSRTP